ncbi:Ferritin, Dps family protein [Alkaliphilus metalliredigens QYMF]|uniref:Ferritin n=1 Tax=Alkaliphilus metalliredigens (strain QYMF) TaxID=293826 RepID=A6TMX8_ALKMQ|nr:ferritin [Alkaliphilus metalliredigens]ABR47546.1 Ferritin, Dps family protein [Alkaliphilus metalliredigens QYMF]
MLSEKLLQEFNEQVKHEFFSANYYLAMAAYCKSEDLEGFANFFIVQAEEERFHAMKFFNFIDELGGRAVITAYDEPKNDFKSLQEVFTDSLTHEQFVTSRINHLMDIAVTEKNYACVSFLNWFIDEQVEEEATMSAYLSRLKRIDENSHAIYMLDAELAQRTFTPPAAE